MVGKFPVYVSYSWATEEQEPLVGKLKRDAADFPSLRLVLDVGKSQPGDSIGAFLREVGNAPRLILVLSEPYFESPYTLEEFAIALQHGGLNTRVRVVLAGGFRLDKYLDEHESRLQQFIGEQGIGLSLQDCEDRLAELGDSLVSISGATKDTDFGPVLQQVLESYQQFPNPELNQEERLKKLREEELKYFSAQVKKLFDGNKSIQPLKSHLKNRATQPGIEIHLDWPSLICHPGVGDAQQRILQQVLVPAVHDTLEEMKQNGSLTGDLLDRLAEIVGWSAATLVNDLWIQEHNAALCDLSSPGYLEIGLGRSHLVELVVARANRRSAKVEKDGDRRFKSGSGIVLDGPDSAQNTLAFIFQKLADRFMPDETIDEGLETVPRQYWEELEASITTRRAYENIFIAFRMDHAWDGNLRAELSRALRCLPQIWVKNPREDGQAVLVLSETRVWVILGELIAMIEGYRNDVRQDARD